MIAAKTVRGRVDFAIITIRYDEYQAVLDRRFRPIDSLSGRRRYRLSEIRTDTKITHLVALARSQEQGHGEAQQLANDLIEDIDPQWILILGIGGAVPAPEFTLGDVILGNRICDFNVSAANYDRPSDYDFRGGPVHRAVADLLSDLPALQRQLAGWNTRKSIALDIPACKVPSDATDPTLFGDEEWRQRVLDSLQRHFGGKTTLRKRIAWPAEIGTSNVLIKDPDLVQQLLKAARSTSAFEMELGGVFIAARKEDREYPVLAIRGISDVVGFKRSPDWTAYACHSAAAFAFRLLKTGVVVPPRAPDGLASILGSHISATPKPTELSRATSSSPEPMAAEIPRVQALWNVPHPRNPSFTARTEILQALRKALHRHRTVALTGVSGIGKSQIAIEYCFAYRHRHVAVLWCNAANTEALLVGIRRIADVLGLPTHAVDDGHVLSSVKHWFANHAGWLLVFDNVDDFADVEQVLPSAAKGHIILTTQARSVGPVARTLEVLPLSSDEGALFLFRRSGRVHDAVPLDEINQEDRAIATEITVQLGGLPLALDQAGAFIQETPATLAEYLALYSAEGARLRARRGSAPSGHPASVSATLSLAISKLQTHSPVAVDLLCFCAFMASSPIPEELAARALAATSGDRTELSFLPALSDASRYSLVGRDLGGRTLTSHHMVQAVIRDSLDPPDRTIWAIRVIRALRAALPDDAPLSVRAFDALLPHVANGAQLISALHLEDSEASQLLTTYSEYLQRHARFDAAMQTAQQVLRMEQQLNGADHPLVALRLTHIADIHKELREPIEALRFYAQAVAILRQHSATASVEMAVTLAGLGDLFRVEGLLRHAEALLRRAHRVLKAFGQTDARLADVLSSLFLLYRSRGLHKKAEAFCREALSVAELDVRDDAAFASCLNNLAMVSREKGDYEGARRLYLRIIDLLEHSLGKNHPQVSLTLNNLAAVYRAENRYTDATPLYRRALDIQTLTFGEQHPEVASMLTNLAVNCIDLDHPEEAVRLARRALTIQEEELGQDHFDTCRAALALGGAYHKIGRYKAAEALYRRGIIVLEGSLGPEHPRVGDTLWNLATLLDETDREDQAAALFARIRTITKDGLSKRPSEGVR